MGVGPDGGGWTRVILVCLCQPPLSGGRGTYARTVAVRNGRNPTASALPNLQDHLAEVPGTGKQFVGGRGLGQREFPVHDGHDLPGGV